MGKETYEKDGKLMEKSTSFWESDRVVGEIKTESNIFSDDYGRKYVEGEKEATLSNIFQDRSFKVHIDEPGCWDISGNARGNATISDATGETIGSLRRTSSFSSNHQGTDRCGYMEEPKTLSLWESLFGSSSKKSPSKSIATSQSHRSSSPTSSSECDHMPSNKAGRLITKRSPSLSAIPKTYGTNPILDGGSDLIYLTGICFVFALGAIGMWVGVGRDISDILRYNGHILLSEIVTFIAISISIGFFAVPVFSIKVYLEVYLDKNKRKLRKCPSVLSKKL